MERREEEEQEKEVEERKGKGGRRRSNVWSGRGMGEAGCHMEHMWQVWVGFSSATLAIDRSSLTTRTKNENFRIVWMKTKNKFLKTKTKICYKD